LLGPGDLFGEAAISHGSAAHSQAVAVTDGEMLAFPAAVVPMLAQRFPHFASCLLGLMSARLAAADRRLRVAAIDSAPQRLLALLHTLAEHLGEPCGEEIWLPLQLTQTELADLACLVRETVVRALAHLEAEGEIRRDGRRGLWLRPRRQAGAR
jgi:CRP-like cAMP-binding protein